jgi:hypothetical protein
VSFRGFIVRRIVRWSLAVLIMAYVAGYYGYHALRTGP